MGLDRKYALEQFQRAGMGSEAARRLADELEDELQNRLHVAVKHILDEVVSELNAMGHSLRNYSDPRPGEFSLRDDEGKGAGYLCRLRLGVDTIVSAGFGDTTNDS